MDVSYTGTRNVLELARLFDVESILLFSSSEVYGTPDPQALLRNHLLVGFRLVVIVAVMILQAGLETLAYIYHEKHSSPVLL